MKPPSRLTRIVAPLLAVVTASVAFALPSAQAESTAGGKPDPHSAAPLVIGHRGASGYRPEHTLASYELAARMGADYIEPDLVSTKDGVLIARHENEIGGTTNVAEVPAFAARKTTKSIDGVAITGWFTEDFTLAEIKTLRAKERLPLVRQENTLYDGLYQVPTFAEVLALRAKLSKQLHRTIGVYPETKHPTYFASIGLPLEKPLVKLLQKAGLDRKSSPVFIQSFEITNLIAMRTKLRVGNNLVFLTSAAGAPFDLVSAGDPRTYADLTSPKGLKQLAAYINGIGPDKSQIIPRNADGTLGTPTSLVKDAHNVGLLLHPYTFRAENTFLPTELKVGTNPNDYGKAIAEQITFLKTGIDGLFTDQADIGVTARKIFLDGS